MTKNKPIYQGENNGDVIDFFIPKEYNNKDVSEALVKLNYLLPNGVSGYIYLDKDEDDYDNFSLYHFTITTMFTHFAGRVIFWLTLLKDEELTILHTSQSYFDVIETIDVDYGTHGEHEVDERLIQIQNLQNTTIEQLAELKNMIIDFNIPSIIVKIDNLTSKIDMLEIQCNELAETKLDTSTANELAQEQKRMLNTLNAQLNDLKRDIDTIETKIEQTFSQQDRQVFEELRTKVATQQQRIQLLETNISTESNRLDETQISVDDNKAEITSISNSVNEIVNNINVINSDIDNINKQLDNLNQSTTLRLEDTTENTTIKDTQVRSITTDNSDMTQIRAVMGSMPVQTNTAKAPTLKLDTKVCTLKDIQTKNTVETKQILSYVNPVGVLTNYTTNQ